MSSRPPEIRQAAQALDLGTTQARVGFGLQEGLLLAGGPIEMTFLVDIDGPGERLLAVSGDSMRQRPGQFAFDASMSGRALPDPLANLPDMGGPISVIAISAGAGWRQPLLLNQFVALEQTYQQLADGEQGHILLSCQRRVKFADNESQALREDDGQLVNVALVFNVTRNDAALSALATGWLSDVVDGPLDLREPALAKLFAMRSAARTQIGALTGHPDHSVASRAEQTLIAITRRANETS